MLRVLEMVGCRNEGGWTMAEGRYVGTVRAPDFPPEMDLRCPRKLVHEE